MMDELSKILRKSSAFFLCLLAPSLAHSEDTTIRGHVKYQSTVGEFQDNDLAAEVGRRNPIDNGFDIRLNAEHTQQGFEFIAHGEVVGSGGDTFRTQDKLASTQLYDFLPRSRLSDRTRFFDLSTDIIDDHSFGSEARLDRLSFGYTGDSEVLRIGRQAISWGNGLVFQAIDPFNPFAPTDIDKDYKTGDDMIYGQLLYPSGDDLQLLIIPRRDQDTHDIEDEQSSFALKQSIRSNYLDSNFDLVAASHYGEALFGGGFNRTVFDAVFRSDVSIVDLEDGEKIVNVIANIDRSGTFLGKNVYGFLEYFRSGTGNSSNDYLKQNPELFSRIERGELYTLGQDYITVGGRVEWTPLLNIFLSDIINLHDSSGYSQIRFEYDLLESFQIMAGIDIPYGERDSEFGGIPLSGFPSERETLLASAKRAYVRLAYYY